MIKRHFHRQRVKATILGALRLEIARQLRGRLDPQWSLPTHLAVLIERLAPGSLQ